MIYEKLPVVLLSTLATEQKKSTNALIASYILKNKEEVKNMGIKDLSLACHVSNSSISRFCKEIGLLDFNELKQLIINDHSYFEKVESKDYISHIHQSLDQVHYSIDLKQIKKLCLDMKQYQNIASFGLLKATSAALSLQSDLLMQNIFIYTNVNYYEQIDYLIHSDEKDLIIIFSYTGSYFDYPKLRKNIKLLNKPKIWMITSHQDSYPDFVDKVIEFESQQDQLSHPYQLIYIASLISQNM